VLEVNVQDAIRTALADNAIGVVGQETVRPSGDVGVRLTLPLKFSLDVSVTFSNALVWPMFKSRPAADIEKSPTLTVNTKERLSEVAESEPFIVTVYVPGVVDLNAHKEMVDVTVEFRVTGLGEQPVTLNPDGETEGNNVIEPVR
jgi:hypothetical protein